jgi:hypothetical protein
MNLRHICEFPNYWAPFFPRYLASAILEQKRLPLVRSDEPVTQPHSKYAKYRGKSDAIYRGK